MKKLLSVFIILVLAFPSNSFAAYRKSKGFDPSIKPPTGAMIDWSNPITTNLSWLSTFDGNGNSTPIDLVKKSVITKTGTLTYASSTMGKALFRGANNNNTDRLDINTPSLGSSYTIFSVQYKQTVASASSASIVDDDSGTEPNRFFQYRINPSNICQFIAWGDAGGFQMAASGALSNNARSYGWTQAARISSVDSVPYIFVNGIKYSGPSIDQTPRTPRTSLRVYEYKDIRLPLDRFDSGGILFLAFWSRALTDNEIKSLHQNPYQLLVAPRRRIISQGASTTTTQMIPTNYYNMTFYNSTLN